MSAPDGQQPDRPRTVRDNWWWSGGLWLVAGGAVFYYQWPSLSGQTEGIWANWLMAAIGLGLAGAGAWRLWRDWRAQAAAPGPSDDDGTGRD